MPSVPCLSCLSACPVCLSVCNVGVLCPNGRIKMKLGMQVGLGAPSPISAHFYCGQTAACIKMPLGILMHAADEGQIWCAIAYPRYTLTWQLSSGSLYSVALCWRKTSIFAFFGLRHFVLSPFGNSLTKLNTSTQLQTFPYPTASKLFLYSNVFMAKSGAQTLTFKTVTDKSVTE